MEKGRDPQRLPLGLQTITEFWHASPTLCSFPVIYNHATEVDAAWTMELSAHASSSAQHIHRDDSVHPSAISPRAYSAFLRSHCPALTVEGCRHAGNWGWEKEIRQQLAGRMSMGVEVELGGDRTGAEGYWAFCYKWMLRMAPKHSKMQAGMLALSNFSKYDKCNYTIWIV